MGKILVKTILTAVAVFKRHNSECDLQQDIMLFHVLCKSDFQSICRKKKVK